MKKSNLISLMITAAFAANGIQASNLCFAEGIDPSQPETFDISTLGIRGDLNNDGEVSVFDLIRYKKYLLGSEISSSDYQMDINSDGKKDICDLIALDSAILGNTKIWSPKNMPVMDGSTSAIPLEAGFKSKMLGISYPNAKSIVKHHKTHESFQMLLSGENDMIFSVPISESQQKDADEAGVKLNLIPVAREGFVFVVNKNNPVDSLTQEQIQGIYSGKITNWSQVGGNDEKIIAYQRNTDSGSQNYMTEFMKDSNLIDAPKDYRPVSMGGLMDAIAVYDNSQNAIGYSVYSYAAQMYENSADVKFIAVDGVKPSRVTMADNTYPLLSNTYIIYTNKASQNTLDFVDWAVSDEGQQCALENGYVPVADIDYPDNLKLYNSKGTGKAKPADYKPSEKISEFSQTFYASIYNNSNFSIDLLKDKKFQDQINDDIGKALEKFNNPDVSIYAVNGYMSITLSEKKYIDDIGSEYGWDALQNVKILNYDLINKKKIENFSDLFYKDIDFISMINDSIASKINSVPSKYIRTDFLGITGTVDDFSINSIFLGDNNPYLTYNFLLNYNSYYLPDCMVTGEYYNMRPILEDKYSCYDCYSNEWNSVNYQADDGEYRQMVEGSRFHSASEVEERAKVYEKVFNAGKEIRKEFKSDYAPADYIPRIIISDSSPSNYYSSLNVLYVNLGKIDGDLGPDMFDPYTGNKIFISDILGKEFIDYDNNKWCISKIDLESKKATLATFANYQGIMVDINPDHINMKYIYPMPHTVEITELEKPLTGEIDHFFENFPGYASSYILEYGPEKEQWPIEGNWHITAKRKCYSHGQCWYECWDTDDNDYYGWINELNVKFY